jgi:hypothetical protein
MDAIGTTSDLKSTGSPEAIGQVLYQHNMAQLMFEMNELIGALMDILHRRLLKTPGRRPVKQMLAHCTDPTTPHSISPQMGSHSQKRKNNIRLINND